MLQRLSRWFLAIFLSLLFVVSNLVVPAASANGNIDFNRRGSLTVHLYERPVVSSQAHNGTQLQPTPSNPPLANVGVVAYPLPNIDLATSAGWATLQNLSGEDALANHADVSTVNSYSAITNAQGVAEMTNMKVGAYVVQVMDNTIANGIVSLPAPFIVTIPFPSKDTATGTTSWLYDVHVYPKGTKTGGPVKTVNDSNAFKEGDIVTWTITQKVPELNTGEKFKNFYIADPLEERLEYVSTTLKINGINQNLPVVNLQQTPADLADCSRKICVIKTPGNTTTDILTGYSGSETAVLEAGQTVTLEITTRVKNSGEIENFAQSIMIGPITGVEILSNTVNTSWGYFTVLKQSRGDNQPLSGAVFEVYKDNACTPAQKIDIPAGQLTTTANGKFNNPLLLKAGTYYVKEVTAPAGYIIPANNCVPVTVEPTHSATAPATLVIDNEKPLIPNLPLTGGQGQALLFAVGGGLLVVTVVIAAARRRKTANI